jgi:hypothetical protein
MAKYNPNLTVEEALAPYVETLEKGKLTGKLTINSSTSKRSGALFVSEGLVYAIQVKNYPSRLYTRLLGTGSLREDHVEDIEHRFGRDQLNTDVIAYATRSMMLSDLVAQALLWEHNLGAWDDLFNWVGVKLEWKEGATTSEATIWPNRNSLARFVHLAKLRKAALAEIAQKYTVSVDKLPNLTYRTVQENYEGENYEPLVVAYGTGDYSAQELVKLAGINLHDAISTIYDLWEKDVVDVHYEGMRLSRKNINLMKSDPLSYGEAQPLIHADEPGAVSVADEAETTVAIEDEPLSDEAVKALLDGVEPETAEVPEDHEEAVSAAAVAEDPADLEFVDTLDPEDQAYEDEEEEQAQAEELHLVDDELETQTEAEAAYEETFENELTLQDLEEEEDDDEPLPLAEEEPGMVEDAIDVDEPTEAPSEDLADVQVAEPVAPAVAVSAPQQQQHEEDFNELFERVKGKLASMRARTEEAASNMLACDDAIESDSSSIEQAEQTISQLEQQISELRTAAAEARARISENETTREQWEHVYDENAEGYNRLKDQLAGLRNL